VRWSCNDRVDVGVHEFGDDQSFAVDASRNGFETGVLDSQALPAPGWIFDCDSSRSARAECTPDDTEPVRRPAGDDDSLRIGDDSAPCRRRRLIAASREGCAPFSVE